MKKLFMFKHKFSVVLFIWYFLCFSFWGSFSLFHIQREVNLNNTCCYLSIYRALFVHLCVINDFCVYFLFACCSIGHSIPQHWISLAIDLKIILVNNVYFYLNTHSTYFCLLLYGSQDGKYCFRWFIFFAFFTTEKREGRNLMVK
jgi:hypothetical protein